MIDCTHSRGPLALASASTNQDTSQGRTREVDGENHRRLQTPVQSPWQAIPKSKTSRRRMGDDESDGNSTPIRQLDPVIGDV
ncbi:hypothetical protein BELL_0932g00020 [Botrytis elliptica]|uniref:Uncharacterized protein n=1 Tax=Botrytis elliptica TaxID=278938 RepID=A0A4Z1JC92_9HELO|nr:hypothetical protein BELL_0932g00020 [Botrytis elliptica]